VFWGAQFVTYDQVFWVAQFVTCDQVFWGAQFVTCDQVFWGAQFGTRYTCVIDLFLKYNTYAYGAMQSCMHSNSGKILAT
jgi:hypothetical protein